MKKLIFPSVSLLTIQSLYAGTGGTNDVDLMYLMFVGIIGLILLIWNGIDYLKNNRSLIRSKLQNARNQILSFFGRFVFQQGF